MSSASTLTKSKWLFTDISNKKSKTSTLSSSKVAQFQKSPNFNNNLNVPSRQFSSLSLSSLSLSPTSNPSTLSMASAIRNKVNNVISKERLNTQLSNESTRRHISRDINFSNIRQYANSNAISPLCTNMNGVEKRIHQTEFQLEILRKRKIQKEQIDIIESAKNQSLKSQEKILGQQQDNAFNQNCQLQYLKRQNNSFNNFLFSETEKANDSKYQSKKALENLQQKVLVSQKRQKMLQVSSKILKQENDQKLALFEEIKEKIQTQRAETEKLEETEKQGIFQLIKLHHEYNLNLEKKKEISKHMNSGNSKADTQFTNLKLQCANESHEKMLQMITKLQSAVQTISVMKAKSQQLLSDLEDEYEIQTKKRAQLFYFLQDLKKIQSELKSGRDWSDIVKLFESGQPVEIQDRVEIANAASKKNTQNSKNTQDQVQVDEAAVVKDLEQKVQKEQEAASKEQGTGNKEQKTTDKEQEAANKQEEFGSAILILNNLEQEEEAAAKAAKKESKHKKSLSIEKDNFQQSITGEPLSSAQKISLMNQQQRSPSSSIKQEDQDEQEDPSIIQCKETGQVVQGQQMQDGNELCQTSQVNDFVEIVEQKQEIEQSIGN